MEYNGKKITFVEEDNEKAIFKYGRKLVEVAKTGKFEKDEARWVEFNGVIYNDVEVEISDGEAIVVGYSSAETTEGGVELPKHANDKIRFKFPTLHEILTDEEKFEAAMWYSEEVGEDFDKYLRLNKNKIDLKFFFEGFFFGGEYLRTIVNHEEEVEITEIEDNLKRYNEAYKVIAKCANDAIPQMKEILRRYNGAVDVGQIALEMGVESINVNYDGGNHPEYDSNVFSEVERVYIVDDRLLVETEDTYIEACDLSAIETLNLLEWLYDNHKNGIIANYYNSDMD